MNIHREHTSQPILSPKRLKEKADILETNLFKSISRQTDPSKVQIKINRENFPDPVIYKALIQLTPRLNINPRDYLLELKDLLKKDIPGDNQEKFKKKISDIGDPLYGEINLITRNIEAIASKKEFEFIIQGKPAVKSRHGQIAKSFFDHEKTPGKLLKGGGINFKEINKYPIATAGKKLFYITHEKQGRPGISFDGKPLPVEAAKPFLLDIAPGVEKIEAPDETGAPAGYYLQAQKTGVILLERNKAGVITGLGINDEVEVKKLDYSVGNIGTQHTCPIRMKIGVVCNGFKIRVNGRVEAQVVEGGEIITNNEAVILKVQPNSTIMALNDITITSATHSKIISERGSITIDKELIDSELSSPSVIFENSNGLMTNNKIEAEQLLLKGGFFSGQNKICFGNHLFAEKKRLQKACETVLKEKSDLSDTRTLLMEKLQPELRRMTKLALSNPGLVKHIKPLIIATQTMNFETINTEMDLIQKINNTKVVATVKTVFEKLEKIPQTFQSFKNRESVLHKQINELDLRMASMKLSMEGFLRQAAAIKIFCGSPDDNALVPPDIVIESDGSQKKYFTVTGSYSPENGFKFAQ